MLSEKVNLNNFIWLAYRKLCSCHTLKNHWQILQMPALPFSPFQLVGPSSSCNILDLRAHYDVSGWENVKLKQRKVAVSFSTVPTACCFELVNSYKISVLWWLKCHASPDSQNHRAISFTAELWSQRQKQSTYEITVGNKVHYGYNICLVCRTYSRLCAASFVL